MFKPKYTSPAGVELRSCIGLSLRTLKAPTSPVYTFPSTEDLSGGVPIAVRGLAAAGTVLSYSTLAGSVQIAPGTNFETTYPTFVVAHQTDSLTGPSEKPVINLKRLRALGFDTFNLKFSVFYIAATFGVTSVPVEVSFYKGGSPVNVTAGSEVDWVFTGATLLMQETIYARAPANVFTRGTRDVYLNMDLSLARRTFIFYPQ